MDNCEYNELEDTISIDVDLSGDEVGYLIDSAGCHELIDYADKNDIIISSASTVYDVYIDDILNAIPKDVLFEKLNINQDEKKSLLSLYKYFNPKGFVTKDDMKKYFNDLIDFYF